MVVVLWGPQRLLTKRTALVHGRPSCSGSLPLGLPWKKVQAQRIDYQDYCFLGLCIPAAISGCSVQNREETETTLQRLSCLVLPVVRNLSRRRAASLRGVFWTARDRRLETGVSGEDSLSLVADAPMLQCIPLQVP